MGRALRSVLGFLVLVAVLLPPKVWRASLESTIWMDETYTLLLVERPPAAIDRLTARDAHPPLYYLGLRSWLAAGRALGVEPGILWARSLNVAFWLLAAGAAWTLGRRRFGPTPGTLVAWSVAGAAGLAQMAQDTRSYGFASAGLALCFLLLVGERRPKPVRHPEGEEPPPARRQARLAGEALRWGLYAGAAAFALWSHLLSGLVLACLGVVWAGLALARTRRLSPLLPAVAANAVALALFLPWLARVPRQLAYLERVGTEWMTPATLSNLLFTWIWWLPFGRVGPPTAPGLAPLLPLGIATLAVPAAAWLGARLLVRPGERDDDLLARLEHGAALGLGTGLLFSLLVWGLARFGVAPVFHGPRYPLMAAAAWGGGLACLAAAAARRLAGARRRLPRWLPWGVLAWALAAPWLAAGLLGPVWSTLGEARSGLETALAPYARRAAFEDLYVMPPELLPYVRGELAGFRVHPIEELPCDAAERPELWSGTAVLALNPWPQLDRHRDRVARRVIERRALSREVVARELEPTSVRATLYLLRGVRVSAARYLCERGLAPTGTS